MSKNVSKNVFKNVSKNVSTNVSNPAPKDAPKKVFENSATNARRNTPSTKYKCTKNENKPIITEKVIRKLEALKNTNVEYQKIYKTCSSKPVPLIVERDIIIKPGKKTLVPVCSKVHRLNKTYTTSPASKFRDHYALFQLESIIDGEHQKIPVLNFTDDEFTLKKDSKVALGFELSYESLPSMESNLCKSLDFCATDTDKESNSAANISPRHQAEIDFENELKSYPVDQAEFLAKYKALFVPSHEYTLPALKIPPIRLKTKTPEINPTPTFGKRNYTRADEEAIDVYIETGILNGLLERVTENDPTATLSPLHVVRKGTKTRVCLDCRLVNDLNIESFQYIFPDINEEINILSRDGYDSYFYCDATGAFNQLIVDESSRNLMAFPCYTDRNKGLYRSKRLMFGIKSAPAIFACVLDKILKGLNQSHIPANIRSYLDDIAGNAKTHDHQKYFLKIVFNRLLDAGLMLSIKKSKFFQSSASFCGVTIDKTGYKINEKRVKILKEFPDADVGSKLKNAVLKVTGFFNWHRKYISQYSEKEQEIRKLFRLFENKEIERKPANEKIKIITDSFKNEILKNVLTATSRDDALTIESDASLKCWGSVCYTEKGLVQYGGGKFPPAVENYGIFEKELYSMAKAIQDAQIYLCQAKSVLLKNDNISAVLSANKIKQKLTSRALKYLMIIQNHTSDINCKIVWINTRQNQLCDTISRLNYDADGNVVLDEPAPHVSSVEFSHIPVTDYLTELHKMTHWSVEKLLKNAKLLNINVSEKEIKTIFYECKKCARWRRLGPKSKQNAHENASRPMEELHIDFIDKSKPNLISNSGHTGIFTICDNLTRFFFASAETSLKISPIIDRLRLLEGITGKKIEKLYCDNAFRTIKFKSFCKNDGIKVNFRPANLSRSVRVERKHKDLHQKISAFSKNPGDWDEVLPDAVASLNAQICEATTFTPFYLFFGTENPRLGGNVDAVYENNLVLAKKISDLKRKNQNFSFRTLEPNTPIQIRYTNDKNETGIHTTVKRDDGGSSLSVELNGREFAVHKGHVFLCKDQKQYEKLF